MPSRVSYFTTQKVSKRNFTFLKQLKVILLCPRTSWYVLCSSESCDSSLTAEPHPVSSRTERFCRSWPGSHTCSSPELQHRLRHSDLIHHVFLFSTCRYNLPAPAPPTTGPPGLDSTLDPLCPAHISFCWLLCEPGTNTSWARELPPPSTGAGEPVLVSAISPTTVTDKSSVPGPEIQIQVLESD